MEQPDDYTLKVQTANDLDITVGKAVHIYMIPDYPSVSSVITQVMLGDGYAVIQVPDDLVSNYTGKTLKISEQVVNAYGKASHSEGIGTSAFGDYSHAQGKYNLVDTEGKFAHIVGNGESYDARSNAHTLDWEGNAWFAGTVEGTALILPSSTPDSTKRFRITVDDSGAISAEELVE